MLELSCKASFLMQLTAKLGHPDLPHYPSTNLHPVFRKKSPSCLGCQERQRQEAPHKETQRNYPEKYTVDSTLPVTEKSNLLTAPTTPLETILTCKPYELSFSTDKGLEVHIGKAHSKVLRRNAVPFM